jgi:UDP-glucose 4-epimerase
MMKSKCLIVGGNGFIGKNLVSKLVGLPFNTVVFDASIPDVRLEAVRYVKGSINETELLINEAIDTHTIVWLVHTSVPATSMDDVESDLTSNVSPLIRFLLKLPKDSERKFIYLSSGGTVYGDIDNGTLADEQASKDPISSYGLTKLIAEEYITFLLKRSSISTFILRPSNVYGRYQNLSRPQGIIGHVFKSILVGKPILLYGDGAIIRDYIHVGDLIEAIVLCLHSRLRSSHPIIFNIGSGQGTSINEIVKLASEISDSPILIDRMPERSFDCKFNVLSIEKAKTELGWNPKIELRQGLKDVWSWIKSEVKE